MAMDRIETYIGGTVGRTNDRGFTLEDRDGWLNLSKFSDGVTVPAAGELVRVGLDQAGFVRVVEALAPAPAFPVCVCSGRPGDAGDCAIHNAPRTAAPKPVAASPETGNSGPVDRDGRIVRMNCVTNAVALLGCGAALGDVLATAEVLESWVTR